MQIVEYPHPTLRRPSQPLRRVDAELRSLVREMFELMYQAQGVGLAANQVDLPYRLFIMNVQEDDQPEELAFINPELSDRRGMEEAEEGCLSLPGLYGPVKRPEQVRLTAYDLQGNQLQYELKGLRARVVQHEVDHLDGTLFIDRLSPTNQSAAASALEEFELQFQSKRASGEIPDDDAIEARLQELEKLRC